MPGLVTARRPRNEGPVTPARSCHSDLAAPRLRSCQHGTEVFPRRGLELAGRGPARPPALDAARGTRRPSASAGWPRGDLPDGRPAGAATARRAGGGTGAGPASAPALLPSEGLSGESPALGPSGPAWTAPATHSLAGGSAGAGGRGSGDRAGDGDRTRP